jgi:hypothetical protein
VHNSEAHERAIVRRLMACEPESGQVVDVADTPRADDEDDRARRASKTSPYRTLRGQLDAADNV